MGRRKIDIDWAIVDEKLSNFCEGTEVAAALGIHPETLYDAVKEKFKTDFSDYKAQKRAKGGSTLREKQMEAALEGNVSMLIWLGKQYLGQTEKTDHTSGGETIRPLDIRVTEAKYIDEYKQVIKDLAKLN